MKIFAHRGVSRLLPENTMIAFKEAVRLKCQGVELDVQLTKDGVPVVIHDETLERTTDGTGWVKDYLYEELQQLHADFLYGMHPIPTLEEVCRFLSGKSITLNIELKNGIVAYPGLEEKVYELINLYKMKDKVVVSSFNHESLKYFHSIAKDVQTAVLTDRPIENTAEYIQDLGAAGYHPHFSIVTKQLAAKLHACRISLRPYTVNNLQVMKKFGEWGVEAVITDVPQLMLPIHSQ